MLKVTKMELNFISDIDMHLLIEKGKRGGIYFIAKRSSKANNKNMKYYDRSKFIVYLDGNNSYGWAMSMYPMVDLNG